MPGNQTMNVNRKKQNKGEKKVGISFSKEILSPEIPPAI